MPVDPFKEPSKEPMKPEITKPEITKPEITKPEKPEKPVKPEFPEKPVKPEKPEFPGISPKPGKPFPPLDPICEKIAQCPLPTGRACAVATAGVLPAAAVAGHDYLGCH